MKPLKELLKFIIVVVSLIGSFSIWSWWDMRNVHGFCDDVKPGTLVVALSAIAQTHHLATGWMRSSVFDEEKGVWFTFLPTKFSFGEVGCKIEHNKKVVLSSGMYGG